MRKLKRLVGFLDRPNANTLVRHFQDSFIHCKCLGTYKKLEIRQYVWVDGWGEVGWSWQPWSTDTQEHRVYRQTDVSELVVLEEKMKEVEKRDSSEHACKQDKCLHDLYSPNGDKTLLKLSLKGNASEIVQFESLVHATVIPNSFASMKSRLQKKSVSTSSKASQY